MFVKVDEMKKVVMEVSPKDKVQKILNTVSGRNLRKDHEVKSCRV